MPNWYKKLFARGLAKAGKKIEERAAPFKREIFTDLTDKTILEIGAGAGVNLPYYAGATQVYLVEPNQYFYQYINHDILEIKILPDRAEQLSLPDQSVDVVVSSFVLCSVTDVLAVLREVARVLKPGGRFIFIEHVAAKQWPWRWLQKLLRPLWRYLADGCDCHRDTPFLLHYAKVFESIKARIIYQVPGFFLRPWLVGEARKK